MKKLKLYLETSVWNFLFADDAPDKRNETDMFFAEVKAGYYDIFISDIVLAEIADAQRDISMRCCYPLSIAALPKFCHQAKNPILWLSLIWKAGF